MRENFQKRRLSLSMNKQIKDQIITLAIMHQRPRIVDKIHFVRIIIWNLLILILKITKKSQKTRFLMIIVKFVQDKKSSDLKRKRLRSEIAHIIFKSTSFVSKASPINFFLLRIYWLRQKKVNNVFNLFS